MAHTKQALKRIKQNRTANAANSARRSKIRTYVKQAETAIESQDKAAIPGAFKKAMAELSRGAQLGVVTKGAAARKISRLAARIRAHA